MDYFMVRKQKKTLDIIFLILWGYFALESGLFLIHEGNSTYDDEEESEEEESGGEDLTA